MMEARVKEEEAEEAVRPEFITLKVVDQQQHLIRHSIRKTDKLQLMMDMYYHKVPDVSYGTGSFWFDGARLGGSRTPEEYEMEDGDSIDFFQQHIGGGSVSA